VSIDREDLVGFALGALGAEETERIRLAISRDPALAAELRAVERHLALHEHVPTLRPAPALWARIESRLDERPAPRSLLVRFWMPVAAAVLVAVALFWPQTPTPVHTMHGRLLQTGARTWSATTVSRVAVGDGVVLTCDRGTVFELLGNDRLALGAGRLFLDVAPERNGFTVFADGFAVRTTGTRFSVDRERRVVGVDQGTVLVGEAGQDPVEVRAPARWTAGRLGEGGAETDWFRRPTLTARILDPDTIRVVIRNDMPDPIQVAPPQGGEPLFFARFLGHDYPLAPDDFAPLTLQPGTDWSVVLALPRPLPEGEGLRLLYPAAEVSVEGTR